MGEPRRSPSSFLWVIAASILRSSLKRVIGQVNDGMACSMRSGCSAFQETLRRRL
jgi:hypothetical protein